MQLTTRPGSSRIQWILLVCYGLFFLGYFVVPKSLEGDHYKLYYAVITLLTLPLIPQGISLVKRDKLFLVFLAYIMYMLASVTWSDAFYADPAPWHEIVDYFKHGFHLLIFILGTRVLMQTLPEQYEQMRRLLFFAAGVAGVVTMLYWYSAHDFPDHRLEGMSLMRNPNDLALVYGAVCTWGFAYIASGQRMVSRLPYILILAVLILLVLLTQSRGALTGLLCAAGIFSISRRRLKELLLVTVVLLTVIVIAVLTEPQIVDRMLARGDTYRFELWSGIIEQIAHRPLAGSGYLSSAVIEIEVAGYNAHSIFLATFRDGGLLGLALLVSMLALACRRAYGIGRLTGDYTWLAALVFAIVFLITAGDRLIDRPKEVWFAFWLPIAMIIANGAVPSSFRSPGSQAQSL